MLLRIAHSQKFTIHIPLLEFYKSYNKETHLTMLNLVLPTLKLNMIRSFFLVRSWGTRTHWFKIQVS